MKTDIFAALSDATRVRILFIISRSRKPLCACVIPAKVGKTQPAVSQHLKVLREAGLVGMEKDGAKRMYSLSSTGRRVLSDASKW